MQGLEAFRPLAMCSEELEWERGKALCEMESWDGCVG